METTNNFLSANYVIVIIGNLILSTIIIILFILNLKKNKKISELKEQNNELNIALFYVEPLCNSSYSVYDLSESLKGMEKNRKNHPLILKLFLNATKVFSERFEKTEKFSDINLFLIDLYRNPHLYEGLISTKFFEKTEKRVRELAEECFQELKEEKNKEGLKTLLISLKKHFDKYEDLYASFYHRINKEISLPT